MKCRLLVDEPAPGHWNMGLDEAILYATLESPSIGPTFRWYGWDKPTLSLGYFQSKDEIPLSLSTLPTVRRVTGGGAILHDRELTYSIVFPADAWPREAFIDLVHDMHAAVAEVMRGLLWASPSPRDVAEPFLCFERRHANDLVHGHHKIMGSAQRKQGGAILQHGSILLGVSSPAPHLPGYADLAAPVEKTQIVKSVCDVIGKAWGWDFEGGSITEAERTVARSLAEEKYANLDWTHRR